MSFSQVYRPSHVLTQQIDGETVLLNAETNDCFGLDDIGTSMWEALTSTSSVQDALDLLSARYDADVELLQTDLFDLIHRLAGKGLLSVEDPRTVGSVRSYDG